MFCTIRSEIIGVKSVGGAKSAFDVISAFPKLELVILATPTLIAKFDANGANGAK